MTDIDRPPLDEFGNAARTWEIPDGAFVYRSGDKTFVGYLSDLEVERRFSPKFSARLVSDSDKNYLYEFRDDPRDSHPDFDQEWTT